MDEDLQHLEENLYRLVSVARTLARDVDASNAETWNEPYAYRTADQAIKASRNLRRQLETRWLVSPLSNEREEVQDAIQSTRRTPKKKSYPHVISMGVDGQ